MHSNKTQSNKTNLTTYRIYSFFLRAAFHFVCFVCVQSSDFTLGFRIKYVISSSSTHTKEKRFSKLCFHYFTWIKAFRQTPLRSISNVNSSAILLNSCCYRATRPLFLTFITFQLLVLKLSIFVFFIYTYFFPEFFFLIILVFLLKI